MREFCEALRMKTIIRLVLFILTFLCLAAVGPKAQAVNPPPDGGYPNFNTAEGQNALLSLTTGAANTAIGWSSLLSNAGGSFNTATGAGALLFNTADQNTAFGAAALLFNTTGSGNAAAGDSALRDNTTGNFNTANGHQALASNTTGTGNTANGVNALVFNTTGTSNAANGDSALYSNTEGNYNTANGYRALYSNTTGFYNTANGVQTLVSNTTGFNNTAIGHFAGANITGSGNVCIGAFVYGLAGENSTTRIGNVYDSVATGRTVYVNDDNKIGTLSSSRRYKDEIRAMAKASEAILSLRPVSFRYKNEIDPTRSLSFGLIAEEVAQVDPDLVTADRDGKPETVRYEQINAMLLNKFLKEHRKVQELEKGMAALTTQFKEQATQLQKVSALLQINNAAPRMATSSP